MNSYTAIAILYTGVWGVLSDWESAATLYDVSDVARGQHRGSPSILPDNAQPGSGGEMFSKREDGLPYPF